MYEELIDFVQRKKVSLVIPICVSLWMSLYTTVGYLNIKRNRELYLSNPITYNSEEDFLLDLEKEKHQLGLENITISCEDDENIPVGHCSREVEGKYLIKFNPVHKSRRVLRHELYHIKKYESFSLDDLLDGLLLGGYEEWRATNYSLQK